MALKEKPKEEEKIFWENRFKITVRDEAGSARVCYALIRSDEKWAEARRPTTQELMTAKLYEDPEAKRRLSPEDSRAVRRAVVPPRFAAAANVKWEYNGYRLVGEITGKAAERETRTDAVMPVLPAEKKMREIPKKTPAARRKKIEVEFGKLEVLVPPAERREREPKAKPKESMVFEPEVVTKSARVLEQERKAALRAKERQRKIAALVEKELAKMERVKPPMPETRAPEAVVPKGREAAAPRQKPRFKGEEEGGKVAVPEERKPPAPKAPEARREEMPGERVPSAPPAAGRRRMPAGVFGTGTASSPFTFSVPLKGGDGVLPIPRSTFRVGLTAFYFKPTVDNFSPEKHTPEAVAAAIADKLYYAIRAVSSEKIDRAQMQKDIEDSLRRTGVWRQ